MTKREKMAAIAFEEFTNGFHSVECTGSDLIFKDMDFILGYEMTRIFSMFLYENDECRRRRRNGAQTMTGMALTLWAVWPELLGPE